LGGFIDVLKIIQAETGTVTKLTDH